jgi:hypothetical protein
MIVVPECLDSIRFFISRPLRDDEIFFIDDAILTGSSPIFACRRKLLSARADTAALEEVSDTDGEGGEPELKWKVTDLDFFFEDLFDFKDVSTSSSTLGAEVELVSFDSCAILFGSS